MEKYKIIEKVLSNLAVEYVDNDKKCSEFVKQCDEDIIEILGFKNVYDNSSNPLKSLFSHKDTYRVYRNEQKKLWAIIQKVRKVDLK